MNISIISNKLIPYFVIGFIAGIVSLLISIIIPVSNNSSLINLGIFSFIEESLKFVFIYFLISNISKLKTVFDYINISVFFGLGFSLFELFLLYYNQSYILSYYFLLNITVHIITSLFLALAFIPSIKKLSTKQIIFFLLAFLIHLCYNLIIINYI